MKAGLSTSLVLHAAVIAFGLVTLSAPPAHDTGDVQALPVDIVPIEALTELQQGEKTEPKTERPAPKPTAKPHTVPDAKTVGENDIDLDDVPKPEASPRTIETAAAPKVEPAPRPDPVPVEAKPEPKPEPVEAKPEPAPAPKPEPVAEKPPEPTPAPDVKPDPVAEAIAATDTPTEQMEFPDQLPKPESRPQPPAQQVAKAEEKKAEKPVEKTAKAPKQEDLESILDQAKALVTKEAPAGGGAKRSTETAALGNDRPSTGAKLSVSEMDALRQRLGQCWSIPAGVDDAEVLKVSVRFRLDRSGELEARPEVIRGGGSSGPARTAAESAVRAVAKCAPFNLPADKYETWAEVVVNFDPSDMF
jgi:colicin import membrane protein